MSIRSIGAGAWRTDLVLALMSNLVWAQEANKETEKTVRSFEELQTILKVGQKVAVTDDRGGEIKGKVGELTASSLVVLAPVNRNRTFTKDSITKIRRTDSSWNGALIGLGVGAAIAAAGIKSSIYQGEAAYFWVFAGSWLFPTVGAITGVVVDKQTGNDPIYLAPSRASQPSVTVSPWLVNGGGGVSVSVRF